MLKCSEVELKKFTLVIFENWFFSRIFSQIMLLKFI